jgi:hypothetical protein
MAHSDNTPVPAPEATVYTPISCKGCTTAVRYPSPATGETCEMHDFDCTAL